MADSVGDGDGEGEASNSELLLAAVGEGEASSVVVFLVVEDFFGEAEGDSELSAVDFFLVAVVLSLVVVFLAVVDFFLATFWCVVVAVFEVAVVSFLFAHAVTNASAAKTVIKDRTDFFIG